MINGGQARFSHPGAILANSPSLGMDTSQRGSNYSKQWRCSDQCNGGQAELSHPGKILSNSLLLQLKANPPLTNFTTLSKN